LLRAEARILLSKSFAVAEGKWRILVGGRVALWGYGGEGVGGEAQISGRKKKNY
jgi:hypothetical protein